MPVIVLLRGVHEGIQRLAQRREPQPVVDKLCILQGDVLLEVRQLAVQAQRFQLTMRRQQQRAARSLIAPRDFMPTNRFSTRSMRPMALRAADLVQQSRRAGTAGIVLPFTATVHPCSKPISTSSIASGRAVRRVRPLPGRIQRRHGWGLPARRPRARGARCCGRGSGFGRGWRRWGCCAFGVVNAVLARFQVPLAPRGNDFQLRRQRLEGVLEAHLIVALAGAAVGQRCRRLPAAPLHLVLGDDRPRQRRAKQILVLIDGARPAAPSTRSRSGTPRAGLHHHLGRAGGNGLLRHGLHVVSLAHVGHKGNDLAAVVLLQPRNNDGGIQTPEYASTTFLCSLRHPDPTPLGKARPVPPMSNSRWPFECANGSPPGRR